jgi:menaquinol-cytochrome c reductase iron-sulfur subunit
MSEQNNGHQQPSEQPAGRREMSRRQFLTYTLGGTGAFMLSMPILWNLRFAVDPLLQPKKETDWVKVVELEKLSTEPISVDFKVHVVDGWFESDPTKKAWIALDENGQPFALSPVCKHLGCTVNWNSNSQYPNQYFCPCHGAHYTKQGEPLAVANAPLDQYAVDVRDGWVYLGQLMPNQLV